MKWSSLEVPGNPLNIATAMRHEWWELDKRLIADL